MTVKRNPKQAGTNFWDCIVQTGPCPMNCNQCFYNRPGAYYVPLGELPLIPDPEEVGDGIVRMNCGHDSNVDFEKVIEAASRYKHAFFNTSIPRLAHFPGPVVFTANMREEEQPNMIAPSLMPENLMSVRLRVSATNLDLIDMAVEHYTACQVPVVITMMAYYDQEPDVNENEINDPGGDLTAAQCYEWKVRHINSYWCPTPALMRAVMDRYADNRLVTLCGSLNSYFCRDCRNCETYFIQTMKRLRGE